MKMRPCCRGGGGGGCDDANDNSGGRGDGRRRARGAHRCTFDVAFPQVPGKRGYALVLHKRWRTAEEQRWAESRFAGGDDAAGELVFEDLEAFVTAGDWQLLLRFKHDSDKHGRRRAAAACSPLN